MSKEKVFLALTEKQKYLPCRDVTYMEDFFITNLTGDQPETPAVAEAKTLCAHCPILKECRAEGIRTQEKWAVMGGLSPADRDEINQENNQENQELAA